MCIKEPQACGNQISNPIQPVSLHLHVCMSDLFFFLPSVMLLIILEKVRHIRLQKKELLSLVVCIHACLLTTTHHHCCICSVCNEFFSYSVPVSFQWHNTFHSISVLVYMQCRPVCVQERDIPSLSWRTHMKPGLKHIQSGKTLGEKKCVPPSFQFICSSSSSLLSSFSSSSLWTSLVFFLLAWPAYFVCSFWA